MSDRISIVVPAYNQAFLTRRCLECVLQNSSVARELIVVDNASGDETPALLQSFASRFREAGWQFRVLRNEVNVGFGRACNQGIREAGGDYVAVLSNDTWLLPRWDEILVSWQKKLGADMIGPAVDESPYDPEKTPERLRRLARRNRGKVAPSWNSILMVFPRKTLDAVGVFDERYYLTYEDRDLRERMDRAGMKYFQVADCWMWHFSKGTRGQIPMPMPDYEKDSLRIFQEKWGFDPRLEDATRIARLKRRWKKIKARLGLF